MSSKSVVLRMDPPFEWIEIRVNPVSIFGKPGEAGHSVGVMDTEQGRGSRTGIERAEAQAKAVLKAIRKYKRINQDISEKSKP